ncbi:MAG TPA: hypothetical protein VGS10_16950 [Terracidiphilus sp.]|nr:hypothetical protein [Terracidiphilus sp.]
MVRTKGESARRRPRRLPEAGGSQFHAAMQTIESAAWQGKVRSDIPSFISEVFKEELSYRAQARKFLWEFFD